MSDFVKKVHETMASNPWMAWTDAAKMVRGNMNPASPVNPATPTVPAPAPAVTPPVNPVTPAPVSQPVQPANTGYTSDSPFAGNMPTKTPSQWPDTVTGVDGTVFRYTNNPDGTPRNTAKAPTQPIQDPNREQEILKNLNEGYQYNPRLFETRENFEKAYNYANKPENERAVLDSFWNSKRQDADSLYARMRNGETLNDTDYNSIDGEVARFRKRQTDYYAGFTPSQLLVEVRDGNLYEGSQEWNDLAQANPQLVQQLSQLMLVNGVRPKIIERNKDGSYNSTLELKSSEKMLEKFGKYLEWANMETILSQLATDDFKKYQEKKISIFDQIASLEADMEKIDNDVESDMAGYSVSWSRKQLERELRKRKMSEELGRKTRLATVYQAAQEEIFERNIKAYDRAEQINNQLRNMAIGMYQSQYSDNLKRESAWKDFEQKLAMNEKMMNDPATAISQLVESYQKQGIPMQRSVQEMIAEFQSSGMTLPQYLTQLNKTIQTKDEWKALQAAQMNKLNPTEYREFGGMLYKIQNGQLVNTGISTRSPESSNYGFQNVWDGMIAVTDPRTGEVRFERVNTGSIGTEGVWALSTKRINAKVGEYVGVECGQFAREAAGMSALPGGNNLSARKREFKEQQAMAGGMVLFTGGMYDKTYGHIALVESVNPDGSLNIVESNLKNDMKVTRRTISASDPAIHGYYNNTPLAKKINGGATQQKWWLGTVKDIVWGGGIKWAVANGIGGLFGGLFGGKKNNENIGYQKDLWPLYEKMNAGKMTTADYQSLNEMGIDRSEFMSQAYNYLNRPVDANNPNLLAMERNLQSINEIIEQNNVDAVAGDRQNWFNFWKRDETYVRKIENILSSQVLQTLIDAKANGATFGALSDAELQMLKSAANVLAGAINPDKKWFDLSEEELRNQLNQLQQLYKKAIENMKRNGVVWASNMADSNDRANSISNNFYP